MTRLRASERQLSLVLCGATLALGCQRESTEPADPPALATPTASAPPPAPEWKGSLYELAPMRLEDQRGVALELGAFRGQRVVLSLFYTSCPSACPRLLSALKRLEQGLDAEVRTRTRFLLVSLDPEQDVPEKLLSVATEAHLDPERWTLARAREADVRKLAAAVGVSFRKLPSGHIEHSSIITVLDPQGDVAARVEGLAAPLDGLLAALARAHVATGSEPLEHGRAPRANAQREAHGEPDARDMLRVPASTYRPLYAGKPEGRELPVAAFLLDRYPVTNAQFLAFVVEHPEWQRDRVPRVMADEEYLEHWAGPAELGAGVRAKQPVVRVSWFAAEAYCAARDARLPSEAEWETAALPAERAQVRERSLTWYEKPATAALAEVGASTPNSLGFHDLHGLIWEWVSDFGATFVSSDSRGTETESSPFCGGGAISAERVDDYVAFMRAAFRRSLRASYTTRALGFRCAKNAPSAP